MDVEDRIRTILIAIEETLIVDEIHENLVKTMTGEELKLEEMTEEGLTKMEMHLTLDEDVRIKTEEALQEVEEEVVVVEEAIIVILKIPIRIREVTETIHRIKVRLTL